MKILVICSGNTPKGEEFDIKIHQSFIYEQVESLKNFGFEFEFFFITGKGLWGYLKHIPNLKKEIINGYKFVHAHNGLCGLISNLQRRVPVVTTYHGSDINLRSLRFFSYSAILTSAQNILVSRNQYDRLFLKRRVNIIACGVDTSVFRPIDKLKALSNVNLDPEKKYILFASAFSNRIKNYSLAEAALKTLNIEDIEILELKGKIRATVCHLLNCSELLLLTSISEGSPQIIKEAMACNCPIVSTDVGDVRQVIGNTEGCYITNFEPTDVAQKIQFAFDFSTTRGRTKGRERILELGLDAETVANRIMDVYRKVLKS
jgi:glycosyltransferase involved in cell wall biosynthesis